MLQLCHLFPPSYMLVCLIINLFVQVFVCLLFYLFLSMFIYKIEPGPRPGPREDYPARG